MITLENMRAVLTKEGPVPFPRIVHLVIEHEDEAADIVAVAETENVARQIVATLDQHKPNEIEPMFVERADDDTQTLWHVKVSYQADSPRSKQIVAVECPRKGRVPDLGPDDQWVFAPTADDAISIVFEHARTIGKTS